MVWKSVPSGPKGVFVWRRLPAMEVPVYVGEVTFIFPGNLKYSTKDELYPGLVSISKTLADLNRIHEAGVVNRPIVASDIFYEINEIDYDGVNRKGILSDLTPQKIAEANMIDEELPAPINLIVPLRLQMPLQEAIDTIYDHYNRIHGPHQ